MRGHGGATIAGRRTSDSLTPKRGGGLVRRREFIALVVGAAAWPLRSNAQDAAKVRRIGFLRVGLPPAAFIDGFRVGMRELGFVESKHFVIEYGLAQSAAA